LTALPEDWKADPPPVSTQHIGDEWLASKQNGLVLRVPSTITGEWNALFNPEHPQAAKVLKSVKSNLLCSIPVLAVLASLSVNTFRLSHTPTASTISMMPAVLMPRYATRRTRFWPHHNPFRQWG
jgi:hypothetical protein